jgi:hypothetical protein
VVRKHFLVDRVEEKDVLDQKNPVAISNFWHARFLFWRAKSTVRVRPTPSVYHAMISFAAPPTCFFQSTALRKCLPSTFDIKTFFIRSSL